MQGTHSTFKDNVTRVKASDLTEEKFMEKYEKGSKPVIITGITDEWPA